MFKIFKQLKELKQDNAKWKRLFNYQSEQTEMYFNWACAYKETIYNLELEKQITTKQRQLLFERATKRFEELQQPF